MASSKDPIVRHDIDPHWGLRRHTVRHVVFPMSARFFTVPRVLIMATIFSAGVQWIFKKPLPRTFDADYKKVEMEWKKLEEGSLRYHKKGQEIVEPHPVVFRDSMTMYKHYDDPPLPADEDDNNNATNNDE